MAKVKLRHIPYRGTAPALQDLLAGNVDFMCDNLGVSLPLVQAGKLKLLGGGRVRSGWRRCRTCRRLPKRCRASKPVAWYAVVAPPKTPKAITDKINADINEALRQPELQEQLKKLSAEMFGGPAEKTSEISARGSRPLGRGDQGGQYRAAVGLGYHDPHCLTRIHALRPAANGNTAIAAARVPAAGFMLRFAWIE